jgi:hypothetical protein
MSNGRSDDSWPPAEAYDARYPNLRSGQSLKERTVEDLVILVFDIDVDVLERLKECTNGGFCPSRPT